MTTMLKVQQPFDRAVIAELPTDDADALERKLTIAHALFRNRSQWIQTHERLSILRRLRVLMAEERDSLALQIAREGGKPLTDALVETDRAIDGVEVAIAALRTGASQGVPMGATMASAGRRTLNFSEPIGVVVAISAFNHPLNLIVHQVVPAVATGCPVIVKPSAATPLSALSFVDLLRQAGLPEGWCQTFLPADNLLAEALATDRRVAFLTFIGSAKVGWHLRSRLHAGTRCALEHGGSAPAIIDRTADLDTLMKPLLRGCFYHAGQVCVSTQRLYVHKEVISGFIDRFESGMSALRTGDPVLPDTDVGPLITPTEASRVESWIDEAVAGGARRVGGERLGMSLLRPSMLIEPPQQSRVSTLEVFGPTVCVYPFNDLQQAIQSANSLPTAFQASIFTQDLSTALNGAEALDASAIMINDHTAFRTDWMPFAGRRESGLGIGGIPGTMHDMTSNKMVVLKLT